MYWFQDWGRLSHPQAAPYVRFLLLHNMIFTERGVYIPIAYTKRQEFQGWDEYLGLLGAISVTSKQFFRDLREYARKVYYEL
jgi:hypothetical protein